MTKHWIHYQSTFLKYAKSGLSQPVMILLFSIFFIAPSNANPLVDLSERFLKKIMEEKDVKAEVQAYAEIPFDSLRNGLSDRAEKLAFWINTYNAFIIYQLRADKSAYDNRGKFFSSEEITIANQQFSFDNIEHDIIRNSRIKWSLGYLKKIFVPKEIRQLRIEEREPRIHFALNCGAISCPPVDVYDEKTVYDQLDENSKQYLSEVTEVNDNQVIETTPLFSWFRGDFGGKKGVKKMLKSYDLIDSTKGYKLNFKGYDWTIDINNFVEKGK